MKNLTFNTKLKLISIILTTVVLIQTISILVTESNLQQASNDLVNKEMVILNKAHELKLSVVQVQQWLTDISATRAQDGLNDGIDVAQENADLFKQLITELKEIDTDNAAQYEALVPVFDQYFLVGKKMAHAYIDGGPSTGNVMMSSFDATAETMSIKVDALLNLSIERTKNKGLYQKGIMEELKILTIAVAVILIVTLLIAISIGRSLINFLGNDPEAINLMANNIASGNLDSVAGEKNAKGVFASLSTMRKYIIERLDELSHQAEENGRIKTALDSVKSPVIMLDEQETIIYINREAQSLFSTQQNEFKKSNPSFNAQQILNTPASPLFSSNTGFWTKLVAKKQDAIADFDTEFYSIRVNSKPVINEDGSTIGSVIELLDRSNEKLIENNFASIVKFAQQGDLSQRIEISGDNQFFNDLSSGINSLLQQMDDIFKALESTLSQMSDGDFTQPLEGNFQGIFATIKNDINHTQDKLSDVVAQLRESIDDIHGVSSFIADHNDQLSSSSQSQAAGLEQTSVAMEQITESVNSNADNAASANEVVAQTSEIANKGEGILLKAINSMDTINESSNKIAEIIGVIDEIAFQTNLLALNASVEAARAGDQGRGFAVVASEVRNLAGRSATAAKEIKILIEDSVQKVKQGSDLVNNSGDSMRSIVEQVNETSRLVLSISTSNREQSQGINQVNQQVNSIDHLTQKNASLAQAVSKESRRLNEVATQANNVMTFFK